MGLLDFFRKPNQSDVPYRARDMLLGNRPMEDWPRPSGNVVDFPWSAFHEARRHLAAGDPGEARRGWMKIVESPGLESLHYVQAWRFLRAHGHAPPPEVARQVLGTVVEYTMPEGLDIVAGYADHGARYYNHSGQVVAWMADGSLDDRIDALLYAASAVVRQIGPWTGALPQAPAVGCVRMSFLTPSGLYFGEGPMDALSADPMGGPVIHLALELMQALMEKADSAPPAG